jgi:hypothetical protein
MLSNSILYYPSIEFQSEDWVKSSLLLWDNVYRIVPIDYTPNDSETIRELNDNDLIRNVTLNQTDVNNTADEFLSVFQNLPFVPAGLEADGLERIHLDKIDTRLYPFLESISKSFIRDGWLYLPEELIKGYMFYLSKTVAQRRNLVRGTDDSDSWSIAPFFTEDINFDEFAYADGAEGYYCSMFLEDLMPRNISEVSASTLIKFVEKRRDLKDCFRMKLSSLNDKISSVTDKEQVYVEVREFLSEVENDKTELKKSMDILSLSNAKSSLFTVGIPVGLTALGAFGLSGNPFSLTKISASISLACIAAYSDYGKTLRTNRDSSYASYLLEIDKLPTPSYVNKLARNFEEFMND